MIKVEQLTKDAVKLSNEENQYLLVRRASEGNWEVSHHVKGPFATGGTVLDHFSAAEEAIEYAKRYLEGGEEELSDALEEL